MIIKKFAKKHSFEEMASNIYYRIHNAICVDVLEIIYKKDYFTVDLSVNCLVDKELGFICIASKRLMSLKNPLFKEYWWKMEEDLEEVKDILEENGEKFWEKYSTLEQIIRYMNFCRSHSPWQEFDEDDQEVFELLNSIQSGQNKLPSVEITSEILQWMAKDKSETFNERNFKWINFYGTNCYLEYGKEESDV